MTDSPQQDYFSLLGLPLYFDIDLADLEKRYFIAQRTFHPDRMAGKSANARRIAISQSMQVNAAYETLKSPLKRASYLLSLKGINTDTAKPPQTLLMEIMELRETLAETQTIAALSDLKKQNARDQENVMQQIAQALAHNDFTSATDFVTRLKYISKIADEIQAGIRAASGSQWIR